MDRVFVMGDIHGAYRALIQCLEKADFDYEGDRLICLGDVCDGWPETKRCINELLKISNLTYVLGNHDTWLLRWMKTGEIENIWYVQGGEATLDSYAGKPVPPSHIEFLENAVPYHLWNGKLFVHAGIDPKLPLEEQNEDVFLWDRTLAKKALENHRSKEDGKLVSYDEVYIGHTPIQSRQPLFSSGVWLMDTGAGWAGVLSMMDTASKELFISDPVPSLYPGIPGRQRR